MSDQLTDEDLTALDKRYGDKTPTRPCPVCKGMDWALEASGMGRLTWACRAAKPPHHGGTGDSMDWNHYRESSHEVSSGDDRIVSLVAEIRRHRAAASANEERVREVVREATLLILEDQSATVTRNNSVLRYGTVERRRALEFCADAIATRAAKQLAGAGLSTEDVQVLCWLFGRSTDTAILGKAGGQGLQDYQLLTDARAILIRLIGRDPSTESP